MGNFSKRGEIKTTRKYILKTFYQSFQIKSMDFDSFFASAEFKAGLIITIAVVILISILFVVDGFCCAVGSKPKNYQKKNLQRHCQILMDSMQRIWNSMEMTCIQRPMGHYRKKYRILSSCQL